LQLTWLDEENLRAFLEDRLQKGGCAAIICNTVVKAQELTRAEKHRSEQDFHLFHARFPQNGVGEKKSWC